MFLWIHQSLKHNNTRRLILPVKGDSRLKIVSQPMALFKWFSITGVFSMLHCSNWATHPRFYFTIRYFILRVRLTAGCQNVSSKSSCQQWLEIAWYWLYPIVSTAIRPIMNKYVQWRNKQIIFNWNQTDLKLNEIPPHSYVGFNCGSAKYQTDYCMLGRL